MEDTADEEAQMATMMGFSAFAAPSESSSHASKKRKTAESQSSVTAGERPEIGSGASRGNSNYLPLGQRRERTVSTEVAGDSGSSVQQTTDAITLVAGESEEATAGANPVLGKALEELTKDDWYALRRGVHDAEGRTVFFQPTFIQEDPWARGT